MKLQAKLPEIQAARGRVAAISVDDAAKSSDLLDRLAKLDPPSKIEFPLLSDPGGAVAKAYGIWDERHEIALPATIIVGPDGRVAWTHVGDTITDRPAEDAIIEALRAIPAASTATAR